MGKIFLQSHSAFLLHSCLRILPLELETGQKIMLSTFGILSECKRVSYYTPHMIIRKSFYIGMVGRVIAFQG